MDRSPYALVHSTAAQITHHGRIDLVVAGLWSFREQSCSRHDLSGLAVPALRNLLGNPGLLYGVRIVRRQTFDGRDLLGANRRNRGLTGSHRLAVQMHRTRAAQSHSTPVLRAGHIQLVAQNPQKWSIRRSIDIVGTVVDYQMKSRHGRTPHRKVKVLDEPTPETFCRANW